MERREEYKGVQDPQRNTPGLMMWFWPHLTYFFTIKLQMSIDVEIAANAFSACL